MTVHRSEIVNGKPSGDAAAERLNAHMRQLRKRVAELQHSNAELQRSNSELERFTAVAAHELSAPLSVIAGYTAVLRERSENLDEEQSGALERMARTVESMQLLMEDLRRYTRAGTAQPEREWFGLAPLLEQVLANLQPTLDAHDAQVQVEGSLPRLWADRIQIGQLLQNLVSNAIKFGPERGGVIEICADHAAEGWGIHVRDHGRGIAEKDQSRIFEPFRRLRGTGSIPGDGLGLAICRQIVAAHGGILTVQSSVGAGATFSFVLPDGPRGEGRSPKQ